MQDQTSAEPEAQPTLESQVEKLLDQVDGASNTVEMIQALVASSDLIRSIAAACESTKLFRDAKPKFDAFAAELEADSTPDERLPLAWGHFLDTVANAPTRYHLMATVRICMPLVARYLPTDTDTTPL